jgi:hypothetical protein
MARLRGTCKARLKEWSSNQLPFENTFSFETYNITGWTGREERRFKDC